VNDDDAKEPSIPLPPGARVELLTEDLALISLPMRNAAVPDALTDAEADVATRVFDGESNGEIAEARGVSARTISKQLESIYRKLGVASRAELVLALRAPEPSDPSSAGEPQTTVEDHDAGDR